MLTAPSAPSSVPFARRLRSLPTLAVMALAFMSAFIFGCGGTSPSNGATSMGVNFVVGTGNTSVGINIKNVSNKTVKRVAVDGVTVDLEPELRVNGTVAVTMSGIDVYPLIVPDTQEVIGFIIDPAGVAVTIGDSDGNSLTYNVTFEADETGHLTVDTGDAPTDGKGSILYQ